MRTGGVVGKKGAQKPKPTISKRNKPTLPPQSGWKTKTAVARKLESLTCWPQVRDMLSEGYSCAATAAFIQNEAQERTEITRGVLENQLLSYRTNYMPSAMFVGAAQLRMAGWLRKRMEDEELEFSRLEEMYRILKSRVDMGLAYEQQVGVPIPAVGQAAQQVVDTICRMHMVKEAYGFNHGSKGASVVMNQSVVVNVQQRFGDEVAAVLQRPAARGRVLALLEEFKTLATDDDGDLYGSETIDITGAEGQAEAPAP